MQDFDFDRIPADVLRSIALNLSATENIKNCRINKRFNDVICSNLPFWKELARKQGLSEDLINTGTIEGLKRRLYVDENTPEFLRDKRIMKRPNTRWCQRVFQPTRIPPGDLLNWKGDVLSFPSYDRTSIEYYGCPNMKYPYPGTKRTPDPPFPGISRTIEYQPCCFKTRERADSSLGMTRDSSLYRE